MGTAAQRKSVEVMAFQGRILTSLKLGFQIFVSVPRKTSLVRLASHHLMLKR
jgi:hypothetical protein